MPLRDRSNNRVMPANARAADVAERAINQIIPVQQRRYYDAFRPQGYRCVLYNRLNAGRKCSCQASRKQVNSLLGKDGKASQGTINQMLAGEMEFSVTDYAHGQDRLFGADVPDMSSPHAPVNKYQGVFDIVTAPGDSAGVPFAREEAEGGFGDNGPVTPWSIDDLVGDWDTGVMAASDMACPVCFGSGFVGGYAPFNTFRQVLTVTDVQANNAEVDLVAKPFVAFASSFDALVTIPRGAIAVDGFRVWNGVKPVNARFTIDGTPINSTADILAKADGKRHLINATFNAKFTHFEMQYNVSQECAYFEFPRRPSGSDTSMLEQMDPFQIIMSPNVPQVDTQDIITESQLGKVLIVQNSNPWESRNRQTLGWEVQVRVLQPAEIPRILPKRYRVLTKDRTTNMVHANAPQRT